MAESDLFADAPKPPSELAKKGDAGNLAVSQAVTALGSRLRVLEERYSNLRHKTQVTDQNMLELEKDLGGEVKQMRDALEELKKELDEVARRSLQLAEEMRGTVKQSEFKVLEKYLEFWEPLEFVTREEVDRVLGRKPVQKAIPEEDPASSDQ